LEDHNKWKKEQELKKEKAKELVQERLKKAEEEDDLIQDIHIKEIDDQVNSNTYKSCIANDPELIEA
jgi:hypothetical protein